MSNKNHVNILINIPEDIYKRLKAGDTNAGNTFFNTALESISNGIILPKVLLSDSKARYNFKAGYKQAILDGKTNLSRPQRECRTCRHRDPEDKKCDCGELERAGCLFPVSDDYFCKFYEKGGTE